VSGSDSGSCPMTGFCFSDAERSGSSVREFVRVSFVVQERDHLEDFDVHGKIILK
jgi:hypothetical protein